jgi:hypothetical protein
MTAEGPGTLKASAPAKSAPAPRFGVLQRQCACGGAAGLDGECAECTQTGMSLQRRSSERAAAGPVPPAVHEVLGSPGTSLDSATRAYMEPRFGHDFSRVRVHADERAAESARAVHALAYTVGRDIVFGAGQYAPTTPDGRRLLAHELTHTVQQRFRAWGGEPLSIDSSRGLREREAQTAADGTGLAGSATESGLAVARQGPALAEAPPPQAFRPPPPMVRTPPRAVPEAANEAETKTEKAEDFKTPDRRQFPSPQDNSLEAVLERARQEPDVEAERQVLEIPLATLAPGGSPPNFVTPGPTKRAVLSSRYQANFRVVYQERHFHILQAIDYRVDRATNEADLMAVLDELVLGRPGPVAYFPSWVISSLVDPGGAVRTQVYLNAVARKRAASPGLQVGLAMGRPIPPSVRRRGCTWKPMPPAGDIFDQAPSIYCQQVTGSPFEYEVTTPTGERTQFDALVGEDIVIECKCGYETIPDALEAKEGTRREVAQLRMDAIDKQQAKHSKVAAACGLRLAYVVSNQRFQQLLTSRWLSQVPIVHKPWREVCGKP